MTAHSRNRIAAAILIACLPVVACKRAGGLGQGAGGTPVPAKMMDLPAQVIATGTVTPRVGAQVKVGPRVSGRLEHLGVKIGDRVKSFG